MCTQFYSSISRAILFLLIITFRLFSGLASDLLTCLPHFPSITSTGHFIGLDKMKITFPGHTQSNNNICLWIVAVLYWNYFRFAIFTATKIIYIIFLPLYVHIKEEEKHAKISVIMTPKALFLLCMLCVKLELRWLIDPIYIPFMEHSRSGRSHINTFSS